MDSQQIEEVKQQIKQEDFQLQQIKKNIVQKGVNTNITTWERVFLLEKNDDEDNNYINLSEDQQKKLEQKKHLARQMIDKLYQNSYENPTDVQSMTIDIIIDENQNRKKGIFVKSLNGSGKTFCFALPAIYLVDQEKNILYASLNQSKVNKKIEKGKSQKQDDSNQKVYYPQILILTDTRVLAMQHKSTIQQLIPDEYQKKISVSTLIKDTSDDYCHILISTPKLLSENIKNKSYNCQNVILLAIDEGDKVLESFQDDVYTILNTIKDNKNIRIIFLSATIKEKEINEIQKIVGEDSFLTINLIQEDSFMQGVEQYYYDATPNVGKGKFEFLLDILKFIYIELKLQTQIIIFVNVMYQVKEFYDLISSDNQKLKYFIRFAFINSDYQPQDRIKIYNDFKNNQYHVLFTTNLMARGIDIRTVSLVINFGFPFDKYKSEVNPNTYLHRNGRVGRFLDKGVALTIIDTYDNPNDYKSIDIIKQKWKKDLIPFDPKLFEYSIKEVIENNKQLNEKK